MKILKSALVGLLLVASGAFAGGSSPGLVYGYVPTAAQWNSYFAAKLDYTPGSINQMGYWDGSGNFLNAAVSGDCTSVANVFTCASAHGATNILGGTAGQIPYQSAPGTTTFNSNLEAASGRLLLNGAIDDTTSPFQVKGAVGNVYIGSDGVLHTIGASLGASINASGNSVLGYSFFQNPASSGGAAFINAQSSTLHTTLTSGDLEYNGTHWYFTDSTPTRHSIQSTLDVTAGQAPSSITVTASPFAYTATYGGSVTVSAGTITSVTLTRASTVVWSSALTADVIPVRAGDVVTVTYTAAPTMYQLSD